MVISFTVLTLAIGSPIYDKLSESVEREFGPVPELDGAGRAPAPLGPCASPQRNDRHLGPGHAAAVRRRVHPGRRADGGSGGLGHLRRLDARTRADRSGLRAAQPAHPGRATGGDAEAAGPGAGLRRARRSSCWPSRCSACWCSRSPPPPAPCWPVSCWRADLADLRPCWNSRHVSSAAIPAAKDVSLPELAWSNGGHRPTRPPPRRRASDWLPSSRRVTRRPATPRSQTRHGPAIRACSVRSRPSRSSS